jgi:RNA polymerase sigma-70 factor (sigma-E family)
VTFTAVYARDRDRLVRLATLLVDEQGLAEDLVNDAFAAAYERWDRLDAPEAYLRTAVVNRSRDALRRRRVARAFAGRRRVALVEGGEPDYVRDAIAALPAAQRSVLVLRFYEDLTIEAIADLLHRKPGTVKSQLSRALAALREVIEP